MEISVFKRRLSSFCVVVRRNLRTTCTSIVFKHIIAYFWPVKMNISLTIKFWLTSKIRNKLYYRCIRGVHHWTQHKRMDALCSSFPVEIFLGWTFPDLSSVFHFCESWTASSLSSSLSVSCTFLLNDAKEKKKTISLHGCHKGGLGNMALFVFFMKRVSLGRNVCSYLMYSLRIILHRFLAIPRDLPVVIRFWKFSHTRHRYFSIFDKG